MVGTIWIKLPASHADIEPVSGLESGTDFFSAETDRGIWVFELDCRRRDCAQQEIRQTCL
jgi:hypothetical protein